jgi:MFS family permease
MSVGLGMILGPTVGTILYLFGGFVLPFAIFGVFTLLVAGALFSRLPDFEKAAPLSVRATRCTDATSWSMAFVMLVVITGFSGISIMTSTIEEHLAKPPVNASEFQTGLLISFAMVLFALTSPFVGHFDDEVFTSNGGCVLQTSGLLFVGMALLLEAPCPFIEASLTLPCVWLGQACLGSGAALVLMPTLRRVRGLLTNLDDENRDVVAGSVVAVAILCSYCWGPLVSAYLRTWYSTQWAYCVLGAAAFAVALTHTFHFCCGGRHSEAELS